MSCVLEAEIGSCNETQILQHYFLIIIQLLDYVFHLSMFKIWDHIKYHGYRLYQESFIL